VLETLLPAFKKAGVHQPVENKHCAAGQEERAGNLFQSLPSRWSGWATE
jgi:hypothetical protein